MKTRIGIMGAMVLSGVLSSAIGIAAQQSPRRTTQREQPPAVPAVPAVPTMPTTPTVPVVPAVPAVPRDPLAGVIFPPDLIMRNARMLQLSDEQKTFMRDEIQKSSSRFNDLQWQLQDAMEVLHDNLKLTSINVESALSQLDKVLDIERQIKHLHIGMGIRIKNRLTSEQQTKLHDAIMSVRPVTPAPGE